MLARVAETIYWLSRSLERAEGLSRLINVNSHLMMDLPRGIAPGWEPIINIIGARDDFLKDDFVFEENDALEFLVTSSERLYSIHAVIRAMRENARTIRDVIPRECWEQINELYHFVKENASNVHTKSQRFDFLNSLILRCQAIVGLLSGTMNHNEGYTFLLLGRNIERADITSRIIDVRSANLLRSDALTARPFENIQWMSVLKSLSAYQMYRQETQVRVSRVGVLHFLLLSRVFPRSIMHCAEDLEKSLRLLPNNQEQINLTEELKQHLAMVDVKALSTQGLHALIDDIQIRINRIGDSLKEQFFLLQVEPPMRQQQSV